MPTALDRIQVLLQPEPYASVRTLAKMERRTLSAMAAELIGAALKLPEFKELLQEAEEEGATVPTREDPREARRQPQLKKGEPFDFNELLSDSEKLAKLQKIMELL